ncbi:MAG: hypothetical protein ACK5LJ_01355 [Paracoccus sp. (in: a-proteobacteria)]
MSNPDRSRLLRPETLTAIGIFVAAAVFIIPTFNLPPMAALLPAAMLVSLMILAAFLLMNDQRKAAAGEPAETMTKSPKRVGEACSECCDDCGEVLKIGWSLGHTGRGQLYPDSPGVE